MVALSRGETLAKRHASGDDLPSSSEALAGQVGRLAGAFTPAASSARLSSSTEAVLRRSSELIDARFKAAALFGPSPLIRCNSEEVSRSGVGAGVSIGAGSGVGAGVSIGAGSGVGAGVSIGAGSGVGAGVSIGVEAGAILGIGLGGTRRSAGSISGFRRERITSAAPTAPSVTSVPTSSRLRTNRTSRVQASKRRRSLNACLRLMLATVRAVAPSSASHLPRLRPHICPSTTVMAALSESVPTMVHGPHLVPPIPWRTGVVPGCWSH